MHKYRKQPTIIGTVSMVSLDQSTTPDNDGLQL